MDDDHFSSHTVASAINASELFESRPSRETLLLHQTGLGTSRYHYRESIVTLDSRSKTSIHFSPFANYRETLLSTDRFASIVSVPLSRFGLHSPNGGRYPLSLFPTKSGRCSDFPRRITPTRSSTTNPHSIAHFEGFVKFGRQTSAVLISATNS